MTDDWNDGWAKTLRLASEVNIAAHEAAKNADAANRVARRLLNQAEGSMTITEFLTARYDEDEATARAAMHEPGADFSWWDVDYNSAVANAHGMRWDPVSVLADIRAKRQIVEMHGQSPAIDTVLDHLATAYDQHPDFDPAWRLNT